MPSKKMAKKTKGKGKKIPFTKLSVDDQVDLINEALEPEVYPALQMDGGGMEIMDIEKNTVMIRYYGACSGCHIGYTATLDFIEQTLQSQIDRKIKVEVV